LGIASHLGLWLDMQSIGCAKSRLTGTHDTVPENKGGYALLRDGGEIIGAAMRTKARVKPLYISTGHKIDLDSSIDTILKCCRGYRLPEPTRMAHMAAGTAHPHPINKIRTRK
jgi:deoxyribonuclease V